MSRVVFEPMPGKIVCEALDGLTQTDAGLFLLRDPNNSKVGRVIAIYEPFQLHLDKPDAELTEAYVAVGDLVVFGRHNGVEITVTLNGRRAQAIVLKETEILTKVKVVEDAENE